MALHAVLTAFGLIGGVLAALGLGGVIRGWWRQTLGRRRDHYGRVARLGTAAQLSFFSSVLGQPPAFRRTVKAPFWESTYVDRDYYVHVVTNNEETVQAFSVTTRSKRFHPRFEPRDGGIYVRRGWLAHKLRLSEVKPLFRIKLGKTPFSEVEGLQHAHAWLGAQSGSYEEVYEWGRPGLYQTYVFAVNAAGVVARETAAAINGLTHAGSRSPFTWDSSGGAPPPGDLQAMRRSTPINTYTVISLSLSQNGYPVTYGPDPEYVKALPEPS